MSSCQDDVPTEEPLDSADPNERIEGQNSNGQFQSNLGQLPRSQKLKSKSAALGGQRLHSEIASTDYDTDGIQSHLVSQSRTHPVPNVKKDWTRRLRDPSYRPESSQLSVSELNLKVLRRYLPQLISVDTIFNNVTAYSYSLTLHEWTELAVNGSMFLISLRRDISLLPGLQEVHAEFPNGKPSLLWRMRDDRRKVLRQQWDALPPRQILFVMNRKAQNNFAIELGLINGSIDLGEELVEFVTTGDDAFMGTLGPALATLPADKRPTHHDQYFAVGLFIYHSTDDAVGQGSLAPTLRREDGEEIQKIWHNARVVTRHEAEIRNECQQIHEFRESECRAYGIALQSLESLELKTIPQAINDTIHS